MNSWKAFQSSITSVAGSAGQAVQSAGANLQGVDFTSTSTKLKSGFANLQQTVRERAGATTADDITELPQEYLDLERRVDGLKIAHQKMLSIAKAYSSESYDYPTQVQESVTELGGSIAHNLSYWASQATKGTNLPQPSVADKPEQVHKTLPHALSRAAAVGAVEVGSSRLSTVLKSYAVAQDKVGAARLRQDDEITKNFLSPWNATLNSSLNAAIKSRQQVKQARIALDACRMTLKSATGGPKQEQARLDVEAAEEKLVTVTEEAINLMRAVLENPEPIRNLSALIKAQQAYHAQAAEALSSIQKDVENASTEAEAEYRKSRAQ